MESRFPKIQLILVALLTMVCQLAVAQTHLGEGLELNVEASATASSGDFAPLWLYSNRQGTVSPFANSAYERLQLMRTTDCDSLRNWKLGYGADVQLQQNAQSTLFVQQAFAEVGWKKILLTVGQKENRAMMVNEQLSTGTHIFGINARPNPEVRLSFDWFDIPLGGRWVSLKGHLSYGKIMDENWQRDFTRRQSQYVERAMLHTKAGYLRIHKKTSPLTIILGVEMASQYGGVSYTPLAGDSMLIRRGETGVKAMWHAFTFGGGDEGEGLYANNSGNTLGSWKARVEYALPQLTVSAYGEHMYEDTSGMFLIEYDGYGTGKDWNVKKTDRWAFFPPKDWLVGVEMKLNKPWWVDNVVVEYLYTKFQSGPMNIDRTENIPDHVPGKDDYYNNHIMSGWQNYGLVIGNPLFLSPIYNKTGEVTVKCNRLTAWHIGLSGNPTSQLGYRLLATWETGFGTYDYPYADPRRRFSMLAEATYRPNRLLGMNGWMFRGGVALDRGELTGNTTGVQLTISKKIALL